MGAGRTELMRSIFGHNYGVFHGGTVKMKGQELSLPSVSAAIEAGIAYVPEDRKNLGLNLLDSIRMTIVSANLKAILRGRLLDSDKELQAAEQSRKALRVKTSSVDAGVTTLSGGNQQKVVLAKWLYAEQDIYIFDEPTRGIDVNAKAEFYKQMSELTKKGKCILMISSDMPELISMSDRVLVVRDGAIDCELTGKDINEQEIIKRALGVKKNGR